MIGKTIRQITLQNGLAEEVIHAGAQVTDAAHTGLRAHGGLSDLDARIAEDAFFGLAAVPVEVNLLVRAAGHAHAPAATLVLVDEEEGREISVPLSAR